jgi:broad specificity phosphatase PhoE
MRKLILIKHASPLVIPGTPSEQWKLSDKGRESCGPLAEALREHGPEMMVASEEPKAVETAQIVGDKLGVTVKTAAGLHEHDRTNVAHMRSAEFISHMELMFRKPDERVLGRESANEALTRFESAVGDVVAGSDSSNVAIVSHGTVIALFVAKHSDEKPFELWRNLGLPSFVVMSLPGFELQKMIERIG